MEIISTSNYRSKGRGKPITSRSPHRNNRKRESIPQPPMVLSSPLDDWREQLKDVSHVQTSDDSSCSHYYHHHHYHHLTHKESGDNGRPKRTRETARRKSGSYVSTRRRSNEVKYILIFTANCYYGIDRIRMIFVTLG